MQAETVTTPRSDARKPLVQLLGIDPQILTMVVALVVVWIGFQIWSEGAFLSPRNLWFLSVQTAVVGILVGGMVLVIVARQIDLAVGSIVGFTAMIIAKLQAPVSEGGGGGAGWNWVIALLVGIAVGVLIGMFNGYMSAYWGVPAFVVTLAGMMIFRNGTFVVSSFTISPLDQTFKLLGGGSIGALWTWIFGLAVAALVIWQTISGRARRVKHGFAVRPIGIEAIVTGATLLIVFGFVMVMNNYKIPGTETSAGIPVPVLIALAVLGFLNWMTRSTRFGRYIYAIGGNPEAALLAGINVKRTMVYIFALMGFLTAIAGAVQAARLNAATPTVGRDLELTVIAGAVIGGTVLAGGSGTILGAALGALLISSLENGLGLVGVATEQQKIYIGLVLLLAVLWNTVTNKRKGSR